MAQTNVPNSAMIPVPPLPINDLAVLIIRYPAQTATKWRLIFYAGEDNLVEANYDAPPGGGPQEICTLSRFNNAPGVDRWMETLQGNDPTLLFRISAIHDENADNIITTSMMMNKGDGIGCSSSIGRASVGLALEGLSKGRQSLLERGDYLRIKEEMRCLEEKLPREKGLIIVVSDVYKL